MTVKEALEIAKLNHAMMTGEDFDRKTPLYKKLKTQSIERDIAIFYVIKERVDTALQVLAKETVRVKKALDKKKKRGTIKS